MAKTYKVEDYRKLNKQLSNGELTQAEYDEMFTNARKHGLMNTAAGKAIGPIQPFAIGGSDLSAIEGTSPYTSKRKLQRLKMGLIEEEVSPDKQFIFDFGHIFEDAIGTHNTKMLSQKLGRDLVYVPVEYGYWSDVAPNFLAHPDGYIKDRETGEIFLAEVKSTSIFSGNWKDYFSQGLCPPEYLSQVQAYMKVLKLKTCYVLAWAGSRTEGAYAQIRIDYDDEYATKILEAAQKFVDDCIKGIMYDGSDIENPSLLAKEAAEMYPAAEDAGFIELDTKFADEFKKAATLMDEQAALKAAMKEKTADEKKRLDEVEKELADLSNSFIPIIQNDNGGTFTDANGIEWVVNIKRDFSFNKDVKAFMAENFPDAWDAVSHKEETLKASIKRKLPKAKKKEEKNND